MSLRATLEWHVKNASSPPFGPHSPARSIILYAYVYVISYRRTMCSIPQDTCTHAHKCALHVTLAVTVPKPHRVRFGEDDKRALGDGNGCVRGVHARRRTRPRTRRVECNSTPDAVIKGTHDIIANSRSIKKNWYVVRGAYGRGRCACDRNNNGKNLNKTDRKKKDVGP